jgi:hypothetical protein
LPIRPFFILIAARKGEYQPNICALLLFFDYQRSCNLVEPQAAATDEIGYALRY